MTSPQGPDARPSNATVGKHAADLHVSRPDEAQRESSASDSTTDPTTVLPAAGARRPAPGAAAAASAGRTAPTRPGASRPARPSGAGTPRPAGRTRKARLALKRVDPWSVFVFSLVAALFLGVALVVAVAVLYGALNALGVTTSVNELFAEVTGGDGSPLLSAGRIVGGAAVLGAVNVVLLTLLATLGALLYNVCSSFTGGIELTLGERDG